MIPAGQFVQQYNKHGCYFMNDACVCKKTGKACVQWNSLDTCSDFVLNTSAIRRSSLDRKLLDLIDEESHGEMVFVEHGDQRFTSEDIREFVRCVERDTRLCSYIVINEEPSVDPLIAIFPGIKQVLV